MVGTWIRHPGRASGDNECEVRAGWRRRSLALATPHRIGHSDPVKSLALLLPVLLGFALVGQANAAPEPGRYDALGGSELAANP
jgi:hypothetical protein